MVVTTIGFPTKNDRFGVFRGYHHFRKHPNDVVVEKLQFCRIASFFQSRSFRCWYDPATMGHEGRILCRDFNRDTKI